MCHQRIDIAESGKRPLPWPHCAERLTGQVHQGDRGQHPRRGSASAAQRQGAHQYHLDPGQCRGAAAHQSAHCKRTAYTRIEPHHARVISGLQSIG